MTEYKSTPELLEEAEQWLVEVQKAAKAAKKGIKNNVTDNYISCPDLWELKQYIKDVKRYTGYAMERLDKIKAQVMP